MTSYDDIKVRTSRRWDTIKMLRSELDKKNRLIKVLNRTIKILKEEK